jgi:hypothetical protein
MKLQGSGGGRSATVQVHLGSKTGNAAEFNGVEDRIRESIASQKGEWANRLANRPGQFECLEREIHGVFRQLADEVVAGLLVEASKTSQFQSHAKK